MNAILYSSTDTSAPVLTRSVGSLITVLKACLVNGYGSMPSLGYTISFEDVGNKVCVFRQPEGTQMFIQIADNAVGNDYSRGRVQAYKTMSSAYLGIEPCPYENPYMATWIVKELTATTSNATAVPWFLVGDGKGFWLITMSRSLSSGVASKASSQHYIGDYIPFNLVNTHNFCVVSPNTTGYFYTTTAGSTSVSFPSFVLRDSSLLFGSVLSSLYCPFISNNQYLGVFGWATSGDVYISGIGLQNGRNIGFPIFIQTTNNILGLLPGIQQALFRYPNVYTITESDCSPVTYTDGSNKQLVINPGYYGNITNTLYSGKVLFNSGSKFRYVY